MFVRKHRTIADTKSPWIALLLILYLPLPVYAEQREVERVHLYGTYTINQTNVSEFDNRFHFEEIQLEAEIISPNGTRFIQLGYFDGLSKDTLQPQWKVKFTPHSAGEWRYRTSWSDGSRGSSGRFQVLRETRNGLHGLVLVDPNNLRALTHSDGTPHYWWGGKWISAMDYGPETKLGKLNANFSQKLGVVVGHKTNQHLIDYLDILEREKHNGLLLKIAMFPLENDGISWDLDWIRRAEWLVEEAAARGIYVQINFFDTWSRDRSKVFQNTTDAKKHVLNAWNPDSWFSSEIPQIKNYVKTIVARFSGYSNVYWELGNEMEHTNCGPCFAEMANAYYLPWIRDFDPYKRPIGLSEDIWKETTADIGFLHQANELPHPDLDRPVIMNELVRGGIDKALWRDDAMRDPKSRIAFRRAYWQNFVLGGVGASQATWLDISQPLNEAAFNVMYDQKQHRKLVERFVKNINDTYHLASIVRSSSSWVGTRGSHTEGIYLTYLLGKPEQTIESNTLLLQPPAGAYRLSWFDPISGTELKAATEIKIEDSIPAQIMHPTFREDLVLIINRLPDP